MPKAGETPEMGANPLLGFGRVYARPHVAELVESRVHRLLNDPGYGWRGFYKKMRDQGIRIWGAAVDTLENTSRFAKGEALGPMTVLHLFDQPLAIARPYEAYMGTLALPRSVTRAAEELFFPNGTVITPDGRTLIVGETQGHRLTAFAVAPDGTLSNRRVWAPLDDAVFPDGICLDAEGAIWVSDARGTLLLRVREGGKIDGTVYTGRRYAFACMLGGADRRTLFVCTSTGSGPAMADKRDGAIEIVRVDVPGAGLP